MRILIIILIFLTTTFSNEIKTSDDRSYSLKLHTLSWQTNWNKRLIEYDELQSGGPPKDGIPAIDNPKFVSIYEAKSWLNENEPVIFVSHKNETKAYPLQILIWHEIINDELAGKKLAVTFCPLCNASIVFDRQLNGKLYDFGTSGLLRFSDLVMYDRQSESLWQQLTGEAIVGDMSGQVLNQVPSSIVSFKDVANNHPNTLILSKKTGHNRDYGRNPYIGYDDISQSPFLLKQETDPRLYPMQRVATLSFESKDKAYAYEVVKKRKVINDTFQNKALVLFFKDEVNSALDRAFIASSKDVGTVTIYEATLNGKLLDFEYKDEKFIDTNTGSVWNIFGEAIEGELKGQTLKPVIFGSHFWFAWAVFKPETLIYKE